MPFIVNSIPRYLADEEGFTGIAVRVYRTTSLAVPSTSYGQGEGGTDIPFDGERFDTDNMWDIANPTRITINTTGIYYIFANVKIQAGGTASTRKSMIVYRQIINPETKAVIGGREFNSSASNPSVFNLSIAWYLVAGQRIFLQVRQDSGSDKNVLNDGMFSPEFGAYRIGDLS